MDWKTYFTDGLVQIAIMLSLFRTDWNNYLNTSLYDTYPEINEILHGPVSAYTQSIYAPEWHSSTIGMSHPKALSMDYRSSIFRDIHMLGQHREFERVNTNIEAYLVNGPGTATLASENAHTSAGHASTGATAGDANNNHNTSNPSNNSSESEAVRSPHVEGAIGPEERPVAELFSFAFPEGELTKEDLDLIEILWRQDIDLGADRESYDLKLRKQQEKDLEVELQQQREKEKELEQRLADQQNSQNNSGNVSYIVDQETGELVPNPLQNQFVQDSTPSTPSATTTTTHVPFTNTQEQLQGVQYQFQQQQPEPVQQQQQPQPEQQNQPLSVEDAMRLLEESSHTEYFNSVLENSSQNNSVQQGLQELQAMIENVSETYEQQQSGLQRQSSIEQRWQDISNILHTTNNDTGYEQNQLLQNTSFAPQVLGHNLSLTEDFSSQQYQPMTQNLLTPINSSQPHLLPTDALGLNNSEILPQGGPGAFVNSSDSLLQHLLNDNLRDVDLMDMNITNTTEPVPMETNDFSSDSAISSAGSIGYPLSSVGSPTQDLSDFQSNISSPYDTLEGATGGSNDGEATSYHTMETKFKYEPDQSYSECSYNNGRLYSNSSDESNTTDYSEHDLPPDPRKVGHNHTYSVQPGEQPKIGKKYIKEELDTHDIQYTRDQKRAKAMNIPFTMEQMITSTVETFNDLIQHSGLTETQLQLVRDIRRRGKNKVAAQNCRKRKLEVIQSLEDEVSKMRENRDRLEKERSAMDKDVAQMKQKFSHLYKEVFQSLRDEHNQPYDPNEYTLQQTDDGDVFLVPHNATSVIKDEPKGKTNRKRKGDRKH